jgi:5'-nucleotidase
MTNSTWIMSNLYMKDGSVIGNLQRSTTVLHNGRKIGIFGLCEEEWFELLSHAVAEEGIVYADFIKTAKEMSCQLRGNGCDYIIALTHMRLPNDRILA